MKIRPYIAGDEQKILEMDWLLFPDPYNKRNLDNWKWKHRGNNPAGEALVYLMDHDGKPIVHFAAVPYRLRVMGEDVLGSHSIGSMVLPEFQGKGLIKFVADKLFEEAVKRNIAFSYGFPNDLAYDLHKKLMGYRDVAMVETIEKESPATAVVTNTAFQFLPIKRFDQKVDELWNKAKDTYKISVIRDAAFLNWRYLDRPDQKYLAFGAHEKESLVGYVVLKLYKDGNILKGHIIDIFSLPGREDIATFLIEQSEKFFVDNKTNLQNTWVVGSELYKKILLSKGYRVMRSRPLICRINCHQDKLQPMLDGKNWYFTMGDTTEIF